MDTRRTSKHLVTIHTTHIYCTFIVHKLRATYRGYRDGRDHSLPPRSSLPREER